MGEFFTNMIPESDRKLSGIYKITNTINGKVYIGKTVSFQKRYNAYRGGFKKKDIRKINQYFLNSIEKHRPENFTFEIVEVCSVENLAERELYWMVAYRSTESAFGYNLRMDSSTGMITHEKTRKKISDRVKKEYETGVRKRESTSEWAINLWKDEDKKAQMARRVSVAKSSYFIQRTKDGECVAVWSNINQIIEHNPGYKWQNIYAACNGSKASYMRFLWERVDGVPDELLEFVVDSDFSITNRTGVEGFFDQEDSPNKAEYLYFVQKDGRQYEILGGDIAKIFPSIYACFHRKKADCVKHKGCLIERTPFIPDADKSVAFYKDELEKFSQNSALQAKRDTIE